MQRNRSIVWLAAGGLVVVAIIIIAIVTAKNIAVQSETVPTQDTRTVESRGWEVRIHLMDMAANVFVVTETLDLALNGGTFTRGQRLIPPNTFNTIDDVHVIEDGQELTFVNPCSWDYGTVCTSTSSAGLAIGYVFREPVSGGVEKHLQISYRVTGAMHIDPAGDSLTWTIIPNNQRFAVPACTVYVELPATMDAQAVADTVTTTGVDTIRTVSGSTVTIIARASIPANQGVDLALTFPHN